MKRWALVATVLTACGITGILWGGEGSLTAGGQHAVKTKVLHFPKDRSLGYLSIGPDLAKLDLTTLDLYRNDPRTGLPPTEFVAKAQGDVLVPADRKVRLCMDLSQFDREYSFIPLEPFQVFNHF